MKPSYEIPVVLRILPTEEDTQNALDQVVAWIENSTEFEAPGKVTKIDRNRLGRRRLAYEIKGQRDGLFVLFYADIDPRHLPEFELNMRLYDAVLRYLVLRDEETIVPAVTETTE
jgi:small subunit ribosomal protein S6